MSGVEVVFPFTGISSYHHATTPEKTVLQLIAAANHRVHIKEISIGFRGVSTTDIPIVVDLLEQSTAGTPGGDSAAIAGVKDDPSIDETILTTSVRGTTTDAAWTAEPTAGSVHRTWVVHPQTRLMYSVPLDMPLIIKGGTRMGLRVRNYSGGTSVLCDGYVLIDE